MMAMTKCPQIPLPLSHERREDLRVGAMESLLSWISWEGADVITWREIFTPENPLDVWEALMFEEPTGPLFSLEGGDLPCVTMRFICEAALM